ncbi:MAG: ABC transporter substrate-binding protein [Methanomassiliicoccales archaeon]|nr:ABC transporter substrate-binding protein [Methanomassiliicoccales archaeon]
MLSNGNKEEAGPVTLVDAEGRNVTTSVAPLRIVSCSPSLTEIVYALGLGDRLVAVTDYCDWPEDVTARKSNGSLASIGGYFTPSIEAIAQANPDIVLVDQGVQAQLDMMPQMKDLQLNFIVLHKGLTFEEVYQNIAMVGEICWEEKAAKDLTDSMKDRIADIQETVGDTEELPTVVFAVWLEPIYVAGNGTFSHEMMTTALGENVYSNTTSWPAVNIESLLEEDPDYILVSMMSLPNPAEDILADMKNDTLWSTLTAVQNDHVYIFTGQCDNVFSRPGPRIVDGVELMAEIMHSAAFNVTIPNVIADDYVDWVSSDDASVGSSALEVISYVSSVSSILVQTVERRA